MPNNDFQEIAIGISEPAMDALRSDVYSAIRTLAYSIVDFEINLYNKTIGSPDHIEPDKAIIPPNLVEAFTGKIHEVYMAMEEHAAAFSEEFKKGEAGKIRTVMGSDDAKPC